ncbi:class Ib ribonucleoside-diphosphate reductase assembly flavoprotein NrdI [Mycoplasma zalophi]|uniref:Protein NrdI n=1 Tax=Mycoplasma zalophi TaxID=191287 RepID=A0ABS6DP29_9MOLU|nr:class Ib ribonucleoside-diphosphate reductase assembly flavoprotein NrdI [Mycoplasma zalophi]MBU4691156.1 class Ib ribonucleoside-diphosphate reductase assembly flavoprotein NrdI [Mycoplasma zalophi]MBU4692072.1 class Ib ribonucleoside-diphosphate reductase assembly flavoprotein NrdI [Mycoplasma zalophi]
MDIKDNLHAEMPKASGEIHVVYFSSRTENTKHFVSKLEVANTRIPQDDPETCLVNQQYVLVSPTFSGGLGETKGAVPKQIIKFLNIESNRKNCVAVIGTGNTNFGDTYGLAGYVLSNKLNVPLLTTIELRGSIAEVEKVRKILKEIWNK